MTIELRPGESIVHKVELNETRFHVAAGICAALFVIALAFNRLATLPLAMGIMFVLWPRFVHFYITNQRIYTKAWGSKRSLELSEVDSIDVKKASISARPKSGKKHPIGPIRNPADLANLINGLRSPSPSVVNPSLLDKALSGQTPKSRP